MRNVVIALVMMSVMTVTGCEKHTCPPADVDDSLAGCIYGETRVDACGEVFGSSLSDYGQLLMFIAKETDTTVSFSLRSTDGTFRLRTGAVDVSGEPFDVFFDAVVKVEECVVKGQEYDGLTVGVCGEILVTVPDTGANTPQYECSITLTEQTGNVFTIVISGMEV